MVATFLNSEQFDIENTEPTIEDECPNSILDLSLREIITEWCDTMLIIINDLINIFNNNDTLRWQDKLYHIKNTVFNNRRIFYLGITLIIIALLLFYFEISS